MYHIRVFKINFDFPPFNVVHVLPAIYQIQISNKYSDFRLLKQIPSHSSKIIENFEFHPISWKNDSYLQGRLTHMTLKFCFGYNATAYHFIALTRFK